MGKSPCCDKEGVRRGAWSADEDAKLVQYINQHGHGSWHNLPKQAGLLRCGKSCRLRWINYLRPDIKRGPFTPEEEASIIQLHRLLGNKWAAIASHLPGRTDNEIKNFWNTRLKKRLSSMGLNPESHHHQSESSTTRHIAQWERVRVEAEARLSTESSLAGKTDSDDIFLRLWNSEVGKSFRKSTRENSYDQEDGIYRANAGMIMAGSDSMSSNEFPDSSDTSALKLLLDFPGDNNFEFLHDQTENDHFSRFLNLQCD